MECLRREVASRAYPATAPVVIVLYSAVADEALADGESHKANSVGCAVVGIVGLGIFLAAGLWFAKRDDASKTPCERYAEVANRILYNCHSGLSKEVDHHTAVCERQIDPTAACLERLEALTCDELRRPPEIAAGVACARN
tara:strand:+ start:100 stop:522 length:423 start_codon:yes stop_codon:yes gene_type:complete